MAKREQVEQLQWVGRGRSANVYVGEEANGRRVAHKVFSPDSLSQLVFYAIDGAPNPYGWNEHAVSAALARRRILTHLVEFWFGERLALPTTYGASWNERAQAYEIRCEFIEGRHLPLRGPESRASDGWLADLVEGIMKPLQRHLELAGFDGMVWQAGRGNPVAASNFLLRNADTVPRWVWIDLESGVPALFSCSPRAQLGFYLPRCWHYRRPIFDDTDMDRLRSYLEQQTDDLEKELGLDAVEELLDAADELEAHQLRWKSLRRHERGISAHRAQGRLTESEARWYLAHRARWYSYLLGVGAASVAASARRCAGRAWQGLLRLDLRRALTNGWRFISSQTYRAQLARRYVSRRIDEWKARGFLEPGVTGRLHAELDRDESSTYISDFGVHLMMKPFVKALQWWIFPALFVLGAVDEVVLLVVLVSAGALGRTAYTLGRLVQSAVARERLPWVALVLGALPVAGNAAYPAELVVCSTGETRILARFIVYDTFAALGRAVPIWGGPDTLTEHRLNRLPDLVARGIQRVLRIA
ncbi:MAG: hypothetical protein V3V67_11225 [Myxococcota bacterium]